MNKLLKKALNKMQHGDTRAAEELYKKVLRENADDVDGNYLLGALYAERGDLERALRYTARAAQLAPRSSYVQNNLGNIHRMRGDLDQARACYERAIEFDARLAEPHNNLGIVFKRLGDNARAATCYQQAIDCQPLFAQAHFNLGKALWDDGQFDAAADSFRRVLDLAPNHAQALDALGMYHLERDEPDRAREFFARCLAVDANDGCGARLKLAYLNSGPVPPRYSEDLVRQTYETKALTWDADAARPRHEFLGPAHVRKAFHRWGAGRNALDILDLGCGTGACSEFLRPRARRLVGVDLSEAMLHVARQKGGYDELHAADLADYLRDAVAVFDVIVASGVVIFFGDLAPLFASIRRALRPGGVFIFSTYRATSGAFTVRANFHFGHSAEYLRQTAARAGLSVTRLDEVIHEFDDGVAQDGFLVTLEPSAEA